jgi:hypothetical protein
MLNHQHYRAGALDARAEAHDALGRPDEARRDREAARTLIEELLAKRPDEVEYRSHAARVLLGLATPAVGRGDPSAANLLREAADHLRIATARNDRDPDDRASLARLARLRAALGRKEVTP